MHIVCLNRKEKAIERIQNRKLKEKVQIQDTQIQALQDSLREIEEEAIRQKENNKIMAALIDERNDLKVRINKLLE